MASSDECRVGLSNGGKTLLPVINVPPQGASDHGRRGFMLNMCRMGLIWLLRKSCGKPYDRQLPKSHRRQRRRHYSQVERCAQCCQPTAVPLPQRFCNSPKRAWTAACTNSLRLWPSHFHSTTAHCFTSLRSLPIAWALCHFNASSLGKCTTLQCCAAACNDGKTAPAGARWLLERQCWLRAQLLLHCMPPNGT